PSPASRRPSGSAGMTDRRVETWRNTCIAVIRGKTTWELALVAALRPGSAAGARRRGSGMERRQRASTGRRPLLLLTPLVSAPDHRHDHDRRASFRPRGGASRIAPADLSASRKKRQRDV